MLCACEPPVNLSAQVVSVWNCLKCHRLGLVYLTQRLLWRPGLVYLTQWMTRHVVFLGGPCQDTADTLHMAALGRDTGSWQSRAHRVKAEETEVENSSRGQTACCRWRPPGRTLGKEGNRFQIFPWLMGMPRGSACTWDTRVTMEL